MDASTINWILAIICLLAGVGLGALGYHLLNASAENVQNLRRRLAERERELDALRSGVDEHLTETTRMAAALQRDSEALARRLAQDTRALRSQASSSDAPSSLSPLFMADDAAGLSPAIPRDYADGKGGTLSEDFGLKERELLAQSSR